MIRTDQIDEAEVQQYYLEKERQEHFYERDAINPNRIDDSFAFKSSLLNVSLDIQELLKQEIFLANLTDKDKIKAISYMSLALDLKEMELDSYKVFVNEVLLICGVTRGHRGFQQDKFNEQRDIKIGDFTGLKTRSKGFWRR